MGLEEGTSFNFFPQGHNFDRLPRGGGAKYEEEKIVCAKHKKVTIFQIQGWQMLPPPAHPNDVPAWRSKAGQTSGSAFIYNGPVMVYKYIWLISSGLVRKKTSLVN